jgi:hypothetical protein
MAIIVWPLAFALAGALLYALSPGKVSELGRIMFFVGVFWLVHLLGAGHARLF